MMKFVNVEVEIFADGHLLRLAGHYHLLDFCHKEGAQQKGVFLAHLAMRKLCQEDFTGIENYSKIQSIHPLGHHVANRF